MIKYGKFYSRGAEKNNHRPDKGLLIALGLLLALGLVFLSSASAVVAYTKTGSSYFYFNRQLVVLLISLVIGFVCYKIDYHFWRKHAFSFLIISCIFLCLVFIPGLSLNINSSRSWINVFGYSFQPSELVKIFFLVYLAAFLESRKKEVSDFRQGFGPFIIILGIIGGLMLLQPDFGTLFIIASTSLIVYFVGGGKIMHFIMIGLLAIILLFVMVQIKPYQMERFKCVMNPTLNTQKECYQLNQSLIAVGSGGFWGRGLGQSQQKFLYLPEVYGDSIFAIVAEEIGFFFSTAFIGLYLFIFYRSIVIAKHAPDIFGKMLATGVGVWLIVQTFVNIGGVIGFIPMTGVPLPFVSQGGSSVLAAVIALAIVLNISRKTSN